MNEDTVQKSEEARSVLLRLENVADHIESNANALDEKQKNLVARTLELKQIPEKTKEAVAQAISEKAHLIAQAVTEAVHKDIDQIEWKVKEINRNMQSIRMWTRKTVFIILGVTFFTTFIAAMSGHVFLMVKFPEVYFRLFQAILNFMKI